MLDWLQTEWIFTEWYIAIVNKQLTSSATNYKDIFISELKWRVFNSFHTVIHIVKWFALHFCYIHRDWIISAIFIYSAHSCLIKEYFREGVHAPRSYKKKYKRHRQHGCGSPHSDYFFVRILPHISPALSLLLFSARYSAKFNVKYYSWRKHKKDI